MPCRFLVLLLALPFPLVATAGPSSGDKSYLIEDPTPIISPYADFRFRYETDWDSSRPDGSLRDDRQRLRVRSRIGLKIEPNDQWLFNIRARTGNSAAQQSPHLTIQDFNGGDRDDFDGILDLYYARYESPFGNLLLGRHAFPFWKQNELFWHDDVTVTGASFQWANEGPLQGTVGAFYLPDGGWGLNGQLLGAQIAYIREVGDWTFTAAEGFYRLHGEPGAS
ncbi:MAG: putative porin [Verrucomicrobiota bacterium]